MQINITNTTVYGNYTLINFEVKTQTGVVLETGSHKIDYASLQGENDPILQQKIEDFKTSKLAEYEGKDLEALAELKRKQDVYNQKYAQHKGYRWHMWCDYDYAFYIAKTNPDLQDLINYIIPRKGMGVIDFTVTDAEDNGQPFNKGEVFAVRIAQSELDVILKFSTQTAPFDVIYDLEDLETFLP